MPRAPDKTGLESVFVLKMIILPVASFRLQLLYRSQQK
ncbi:hypothetical protein F442_22490 [Phytophthora nicotianae P10297]|uniref:Uncharacterized protein n=1 Tax=Phytophthora nicotianae P10297 TaxID=1317064 RepID=W2Y0S3_PHYNI|nr:hypothetical protein F442_22490 [Phytophthora nicotianae P10297]